MARMRILVAPDKFAGTLTAVQAAEAIAEGWRRRAPGDELDLAPMADGGPGFVDVLHATLGGGCWPPRSTDRSARRCRAPSWSWVTRRTSRAAQACGLHLTGGAGAEEATTAGVGSWCWPRWRPAYVGWSSASAAAAPTTAVPGCWPRSAPPRTWAWLRGRRRWPA